MLGVSLKDKKSKYRNMYKELVSQMLSERQQRENGTGLGILPRHLRIVVCKAVDTQRLG